MIDNIIGILYRPAMKRLSRGTLGLINDPFHAFQRSCSREDSAHFSLAPMEISCFADASCSNKIDSD
jgi:hypothetical protein